MYTMLRPMIVLRRYHPSSRRNREMIIASIGIIWITRIAMMNAVRVRNR